ncbi:alpha/beta hydrolase family protein [Pseudomonas knackmussii]|uniref:alpha/beta hydrolase family protein n=1 Tax=Pseudomonas knackmussii TaxID=65741 RepID=UPI0013646EC5|nr:dienelactone hydrolase family protein [Pseudomonas knackmussii]
MARVLLVLLLLMASLAQADVPQPWNAGARRLALQDPLSGKPIPAVIFYPTRSKPHVLHIGGYSLRVALDAAPAKGRFPLLAISHGNSGSPLAHRDLLLSLARNGFVVIGLLHPGDNPEDQSRQGALSNLYGRPLQVSASISAALADTHLASSIDAQRIGVIGYSAGGETALILAGATPNPQRLLRYCQERPDDEDACSENGELRADRPDLKAHADPRVGALLLLAPLSLMFGHDDLAAVTIPVLLYTGDRDQVLDPSRNAGHLLRRLPNPPEYHVLQGAGHFVFMTPCSADEDAETPELCEDAIGVDRQAIHRSLNGEAARFFASQLRVDPVQASWR